jgi:hypothetical protein
MRDYQLMIKQERQKHKCKAKTSKYDDHITGKL